MAAYATTTTIDQTTHVPLRTERDGIITGKISVTNYNSTQAEITAITARFKALKRVVITGVSDGGYLGRWIESTKAIKCYYGIATIGTHTHTSAAHTHTVAVAAGTAGDAVTNNAGALNSTGGQDLTSDSTTPGATGANGAVTATVLLESANDVNCGIFEFIAYGTV